MAVYDPLTSPAEKLAETILNAAGSSLRHYTPESRKRIIEAAGTVLVQAAAARLSDMKKPSP